MHLTHKIHFPLLSTTLYCVSLLKVISGDTMHNLLSSLTLHRLTYYAHTIILNQNKKESYVLVKWRLNMKSESPYQ